ncbi:MAG: outer membrane beta-barrel protein [Rickettsiales bacterium]|jgi:opacity protein-like surface antigen|nr:outer membrane beta-barrel protein [Rickettsiales bacterium]
MKKKMMLVVLLLSITFVNAAILPVGGYIGIRGGSSTGGFVDGDSVFKVESKPHFFGSVNAGLRLTLPFLNTIRAEFEVLGRNNGAEVSISSATQKIHSLTTGVNVYYDVVDISLPALGGFKVFFGGGAGYTRFLSIGNLSNDSNLAWNIGAGGTLTLADVLSVDLGWRYFHQGTLRIVSAANREINSSDIYAGVRIGF